MGLRCVLTSAVPQRWVQWRGGAARCLRVSPDDTSLLSDANLPLTGNKENLPHYVTKAKKMSPSC